MPGTWPRRGAAGPGRSGRGGGAGRASRAGGGASPADGSAAVGDGSPGVGFGNAPAEHFSHFAGPAQARDAVSPSLPGTNRRYGRDHFWFLPPFCGWALTALPLAVLKARRSITSPTLV